MDKQINGKIKKDRLHDLEKIEEANRKEFLEKQIGKTLSVLFEEKSDMDGFKSGYSTNYLRVNVADESLPSNEIYDIKIGGIKDDELIGKISK